MKKINNKTTLFLGLLFVLVAFGCAVGVLYQMTNDHHEKVQEVAAITEKLELVDQEKNLAEQEVENLAKRVGKEIELQRLVDIAQQEYGIEESERKEGDLWIDRDGEVWMVTLGILNGIEKGSRLRVLDGEEQLGIVVVKTALDVVSYVYPLEDRGQYKEDSYRVAVE